MHRQVWVFDASIFRVDTPFPFSGEGPTVSLGLEQREDLGALRGKTSVLLSPSGSGCWKSCSIRSSWFFLDASDILCASHQSITKFDVDLSQNVCADAVSHARSGKVIPALSHWCTTFIGKFQEIDSHASEGEQIRRARKNPQIHEAR